VYWRDSKRTVNPFSCALQFPSPYPLGQNQLVLFDTQENPEVPVPPPFSPPPAGDFVLPFPFEAGSVSVDSPDLPVTAGSGWMYLNLNHAVAGSQVPHEPVLQNWVGARFDAAQYSYGFDAFQVDNASAPVDLFLPICDGSPDPPACSEVPFFADGFETGDLSAWSVVTP
jgi:hypothetical protein